MPRAKAEKKIRCRWCTERFFDFETLKTHVRIGHAREYINIQKKLDEEFGSEDFPDGPEYKQPKGRRYH
jgi:hypothetical protein